TRAEHYLVSIDATRAFAARRYCEHLGQRRGPRSTDPVVVYELSGTRTRICGAWSHWSLSTGNERGHKLCHPSGSDPGVPGSVSKGRRHQRCMGGLSVSEGPWPRSHWRRGCGVDRLSECQPEQPSVHCADVFALDRG